MENELTIPVGTKLHIAFDVPLGKTPDFNMICTFGRKLDSASFLISIPMVDGKSLILDENQKFLIRYMQGSEPLIVAAYPDDVVKEGIRRYWRMRKVSESRQFFQRRDERIKVALRAEYFQSNWPVNENGTITTENAMTLDISSGGLALYINSRYDVGEMLEINLPRVGLDSEGAPIQDLVAVVCWSREAPKGSLFRFITGLQLRLSDEQKEQMSAYVAYVKKKYRL